jgi:hypothetical protein
MIVRPLVVGALASALFACSSKKDNEGLPPAQEWSADPGGVQPTVTTPHDHPHVAVGAGDPNNPHAGVDMGPAADQPAQDSDEAQANPHAGVDMTGTNNPHAGVDMTGGANPHAGVDMTGGNNPHAGGGVDVSKMGLPAPDPNRALDPTHHIRGTLRLGAAAKGRAQIGGAVFVIAKRADASGNPSGPPLAVTKITWRGDNQPFELSEADAMVGGTELSGDVVLLVRYDQDGDALSKQPGDVTGQLKLKIPSDHADVVLDTVL